MAAEWDETCLDVSVSDYDLIAVTRLQAICRGWLVRRKLRDAQTEFQQIVHELDGPTVSLEWTKSTLPCSVIYKLSKKTRARKHKDQTHTCQQCGETKSDTLKMLKSCTESECPKCGEKPSVHVVTENAGERNRIPLTPKLDSDQMLSDQQVQTDSLQTVGLFQSKEKPQDKDHDCDPAASVLPVKEALPKTEPFQTKRSADEDHGGKDSAKVQTGLKLEPESKVTEHCKGVGTDIGEHGESGEGDAGGDSVNVSLSTESDAAVSHASVLPSSPVVASCDGLTRGEQAPVSGGLRRIDSFHGDQTLVWDSSSSVWQDYETASKRSQGQHEGHRTTSAVDESSLEMGPNMTEVKLRSLSTEELLKQRQNVAMELLWVQQAISSRKKYLKLKKQMDAAG